MLVSIVIGFAALVAGAPEAFHQEELLFPPQSAHNHSSSIVETGQGDLLACWFHGQGEKGDNTLVIQGARKPAGGSAWSAPFVMADNPDLPDQNPVLFIDNEDTLWLFWISSLDNTSFTYLIKYAKSSHYTQDGAPRWDWQDVLICHPQDAETVFQEAAVRFDKDCANLVAGDEKLAQRLTEFRESAARKLDHRLGWMTRQPPIMLGDGCLMLPLYSDIHGCSLIASTKDSGHTWQFGKPMVLDTYGNIQPALVQKRNGDLVAFMRERGYTQKVRRAVSQDGGATWSEVPMDIPNPGSSVACIVLASGNWLLVCNDTTGGPRSGRYLLSAFLSDDEGATWKWKRTLENNEAVGAAYPTVIQSQNGDILCTYTFSPPEGETIKLSRFNAAWIQQGGK